jgi:hypothetical protein
MEWNMPMKNPPHLGGLIRREVIEPLALTVSDAAAILGVTRQALSLLLNERPACPGDGTAIEGVRSEDGPPDACSWRSTSPGNANGQRPQGEALRARLASVPPETR